MKCDICRGNIITKTQQSYQYKECGLDNVYLKNVDVRVCESCGEKNLRIPGILELHETIARGIALQPCPLRGQDIKFLRKQLGYSAKQWSAFLRIDSSTLSRWENEQQEIGPQSDGLIRLLYFRLLDESTGKVTCDPVAAASAAVTPACFLKVYVNMDNPAVYSYKTRSIRTHNTGELALS